MKHATVRLGGFTVPLIGVPCNATQERCLRCKRLFHLTEVALDAKGAPYCRGCRPKLFSAP